ncbi:bifunctional metallophosphatase/5'-nucleotidase [Paenibacillus koleovorans]|uniref:bifunctional metallophosphatase/5'-nucleotidase n=1 Tax=Paenibacillus koleovorans TaxID=121608 RepID=UPI0013E2B9AC|nr:bifunctional metallophosphatase/5'-nucleotidase [Paenibacillus koleovorans]
MTAAPDRTLDLTILSTSDIHGHIIPKHYANHLPQEAGLAKIATLVERERARGGPVLWIDNGDLIQGTPLAYYQARIAPDRANPLIAAMNELQVDAAAIGNHEFNYGLDHLRRAVGESQFPWLAANIVDAASGEPVFGKPYFVRELEGGVRVAVLGLCTPYIPNWENPSHIAGLGFLDAVETAKRWVAKLRDEERADVVVVTYHGGFERDLETGEQTETPTDENQGYALCRDVPGIDVLLTGHQHRTIAGVRVNGVVVSQPGHRGENVAKVSLQLELREGRGWAVAGGSSELLSVAGVEADERVLQLVDEAERLTQSWLDTPMGRVEGDMVVRDPMEVRLGDSPLIEFINKVQMDISGARISNTALFAEDSPGIPSNVTMRDIVSNYIYPNTLKVIRISGQDMRDALELSASYFARSDGSGSTGTGDWEGGDSGAAYWRGRAVEEEVDEGGAAYWRGRVAVNPKFLTPKPQPYNYDMWEGISYVLDIRRPEGDRVVQLDFEGEPVRMDAEYDVVMNNYRSGGGGNYLMFKDKPVVRDIPTDVSELIADYILRRGTIEATLDRNWKVVW